MSEGIKASQHPWAPAPTKGTIPSVPWCLTSVSGGCLRGVAPRFWPGERTVDHPTLQKCQEGVILVGNIEEFDKMAKKEEGKGNPSWKRKTGLRRNLYVKKQIGIVWGRGNMFWSQNFKISYVDVVIISKRSMMSSSFILLCYYIEGDVVNEGTCNTH